MDLYYFIALAAMAVQLVFVLHAIRNHRRALRNKRSAALTFRPQTTLIVPCKGLDPRFDENIAAFFAQEHVSYRLLFVVADKDDPAYDRLCQLKQQLAPNANAREVLILLAGHAEVGSQKLHNLLCGCEHLTDETEVIAFADSDIRTRPDWLVHLVQHLQVPKHGAASGYRWFVPTVDNLPALALSAINAKVAQLLGDKTFNHLWGGSMAVRARDFDRLGIREIWRTTLSDDLSLSRAIKKANMNVAFVPTCLSVSYLTTNWAQMFEFCRRQFVITRVTTPGTWWIGLFCSAGSVLGLWGGAAMAVYAARINSPHLSVCMAMPIVFFLSQLLRAVLRQHTIVKLLPEETSRMKAAIVADLTAFWLWSLLLLGCILSSAFGRTIRWRGIRYRLIGPDEAIILDR